MIKSGVGTSVGWISTHTYAGPEPLAGGMGHWDVPWEVLLIVGVPATGVVCMVRGALEAPVMPVISAMRVSLFYLYVYVGTIV